MFINSLLLVIITTKYYMGDTSMKNGLAFVLMFLLALSVTPIAFAEKGDAEKGKEIYQSRCQMCHGPQGKGDGPAAAALDPAPKDLSDKEFVSGLEDDYMFDVIKKGGAAVGKSAQMPPHPGLSDEDVWNVISFIREGL